MKLLSMIACLYLLSVSIIVQANSAHPKIIFSVIQIGPGSLDANNSETNNHKRIKKLELVAQDITCVQLEPQKDNRKTIVSYETRSTPPTEEDLYNLMHDKPMDKQDKIIANPNYGKTTYNIIFNLDQDVGDKFYEFTEKVLDKFLRSTLVK